MTEPRNIHIDVVKIWSPKKDAWLMPQQKGWTENDHMAGAFTKPDAQQIIDAEGVAGHVVQALSKNALRPSKTN